jgi:hypothetical protein
MGPGNAKHFQQHRWIVLSDLSGADGFPFRHVLEPHYPDSPMGLKLGDNLLDVTEAVTSTCRRGLAPAVSS